VLTYVQPRIQRFDSLVLEYDVALCPWGCRCRSFEGVCCLLFWVLGREDLSTTHFRNVRNYVPKDTASHSRRRRSLANCVHLTANNNVYRQLAATGRYRVPINFGCLFGYFTMLHQLLSYTDGIRWLFRIRKRHGYERNRQLAVVRCQHCCGVLLLGLRGAMGSDAKENAMVTCFITLHIFGCQTNPLKTKNQRERGGGGGVGRDVVGGAKFLLLREDEKFTTWRRRLMWIIF